MKRLIRDYGFIEGECYCSHLSVKSDGKGGRPRKDYLLTLDPDEASFGFIQSTTFAAITP